MWGSRMDCPTDTREEARNAAGRALEKGRNLIGLNFEGRRCSAACRTTGSHVSGLEVAHKDALAGHALLRQPARHAGRQLAAHPAEQHLRARNWYMHNNS